MYTSICTVVLQQLMTMAKGVSGQELVLPLLLHQLWAV